MKLEVHPLRPDRWKDFEDLFREGPYVRGCWCMWWRADSRKDFDRDAKEGGKGNRRKMKAVVTRGEVPGVLAYVESEVVGWCSVAPREDFAALERSRRYRRIDDRPVWSVVCFYAAKPYRGAGLMTELLRGACEYARDRGARIIEGYPVEPSKRAAPIDVYMGTAASFRAAGFKEVARTANGKPIMRRMMRAKR